MEPELEAAHRAESRGRLEEAEGLYTRALAARPDWPDALCLRGCVRRSRRRFTAALEDFDRCAALKPEPGHHFLHRAETRLHLGDAPGALADLERAPEGAEEALRWGLTAVARLRQGDWDAAVEAMDRAIAADTAGGLLGRLWGHFAESGREELRALAASAAAAAPRFPGRHWLHLLSGAAWLYGDDPARALGPLSVAAEKGPRCFFSAMLLGSALLDCGRPSEALKPLGRAIALDRRQPRPHALRGECLVRVGRWSEGLREFTRARALDRYGILRAKWGEGLFFSAFLLMGRLRGALR